jgi:hypothetical protein
MYDDCYTPDLFDTCPIEYITESENYADDDLDGWDEDGDEDEEG